MKRWLGLLLAMLLAMGTLPVIPVSADEYMEVFTYRFDRADSFDKEQHGEYEGFKWSFGKVAPTLDLQNNLGVVDSQGIGQCDAILSFPAVTGKVRVEIRMKNDVPEDDQNKLFNMFLRNGNKEIVRATTKASGTISDGTYEIQAGMPDVTNTGKNKIATVRSDGEFYVYTFDIDFEKPDRKTFTAYLFDDEGNDLLEQFDSSRRDLYFYAQNDVDSIDTILFGKSSTDFHGKLLIDYIRVSKLASDEEIAASVLDGIRIADSSEVTSDFQLPKTGKNGTEITWQSNNSQIEIIDEGDYYLAKVTPSTEQSVTGDLVCTVAKGMATAFKNISVTVLRTFTDQMRADMDAAALDLGDTSQVLEDLELPTDAQYGSTITWESQDSHVVIDTSGDSVMARITRPGANEKGVSAVIQATATYGDATAEKQFALRIPRLSEPVIKDEYKDQTELVLSSTDGYKINQANSGQYPKLEKDPLTGENCVVYNADGDAAGTRAEASRNLPALEGNIRVDVKLRVTGPDSIGTNYYIQGAAGTTVDSLVRFNVKADALTCEVGDGAASTSRSTLISEIDYEHYYTISTRFDFDRNTVTVEIDGNPTEITGKPFRKGLAFTAVQMLLFGVNNQSSATLRVSSIYVYAEPKEMSDADAVVQAAEALDISDVVDMSGVTGDFALPTAGENDCTITWTSSHPQYVTVADGNASVTQPGEADGNVRVTLMAVITRGVTSQTREFVLTIPCIVDADAVTAALAAIDLGDVSGIRDKLTLPDKGLYDVAFTWKSSNTSVLSDTGVPYCSSISRDTNVSLTVTGSKGAATKEKKFTVTVKGTGSGGGGGGSSSGGGGSTVISRNPAGNTSIITDQGVLSQTQTAQSGFTDMAGFDWAAEYINAYAAAGIVTGVGDGLFEPGRNVTREEFLTVLVKVFGYYNASATCAFEDVPAEAWFAPFVGSAVEAGITTGMSGTLFGAGAPITREDMCVMLLRALNNKGFTVEDKGTATTFTDQADIAEYAANAVRRLAAAGVVNGMDGGRFAPKDSANRAQMVKVIFLADSNKVVKTEEDDDVNPPENTPTPSAQPSAGPVDGDASRLPGTNADAKTLALYNGVAERKQEQMQLYQKSPSVALDVAGWGDAAYALAALWCNEDVEKGNACVLELCEKWPASEGTQSSDSYFCMNLLMRTWLSFSDKGTVAPGRLTKEAQEAIEDYFWDYLNYHPDTTLAEDIDETKMRLYVQDSGNHDIVQRSAFLIGSTLLLKTERYKDGRVGDISLQEFHDKWEEFIKHYFRVRGEQGLICETGSGTYSKYTIDSVLSIYDFTDDLEVKRLAQAFLDMYHTDLLMETAATGVRGGAKSRMYKDKYSFTPTMDAAMFYNYVQFGLGGDTFKATSCHPAMLSGCATDYVAPYVLYDFAAYPENKGAYVYKSVPLGAGNNTQVGESLLYNAQFPPSVLKYTYSTPDYVMGASTIDRNKEYMMIHTQNKWMGVVFNGAMRDVKYDSRVYMVGDGTAQNGNTGYNEINGMGSQGAIIVQTLPEKKNSVDAKLYMSNDLFDTKKLESGWLFAYDPDGTGYVAIRPSRGDIAAFEDETQGKYIRFTEKDVPVVIQCASTSDYATFEEFIKAVKGCELKWNGNVLCYTNLKGEKLEYSTDKVLPKLDGETLSVTPEKIYDSPYVNSTYGSGVIEVVNTRGEKFTINFEE